MLKTYKTEINPTLKQIEIINKTIGTCRFVYNLFLSHNKEIHEKEKRYINNYEFSKWLNNDFIPNNQDYKWIKEVSTKSVRHSIDNANIAFMNFFKKKTSFPNYKKKRKNECSMYFVKNNKTDCLCERHRIKIPTLSWVKLKEKGYIPINKVIKSGYITKKANRYYISVIVETNNKNPIIINKNEGIGIDLGIKDFAICSNNLKYKNINKTSTISKLEKSLKRQQRKLSKKYERQTQRKEKSTKNIEKQILRIEKLHQRLNNIRTDYLNKVINEIVKTKPSYITIEDLNISGMIKNKHLSKSIISQKFYEFKNKLFIKCKENNIELRIVDRFYPSSKICHCCENIKKDLKLSDRIYKCLECGYTEDRDYNASLNLRDAKIYKLA